jgi:hypothetical protein
VKVNEELQVPLSTPEILRRWLYDTLRLLARGINARAQLVGGNHFTGFQAVKFETLTDAATITTSAIASNHFLVTLGGNRTLANPTNLRDGVILNWWVKQDGTGSRTLSYGSKFKWPSGTAPTLTTTAAGLDLIVGQYNEDLDIIVCTCTKGFA